MKKAVFASFIILFLLPPSVFAINVTTSDSKVEVHIRNEVNSAEPIRQQISQKVEAKGEEIQIKLTATVRERVRTYFAKAVTRIEALIARLNSLISRIEARIAKINESNPELDTTVAKESISEAKTKIASAEEKLTEAKTLLEDVLSSEDPKDKFGNVVELIRGIKSDLKEVHRLLVKSIGDIKGLRVGDTNEE